MFKKKTKEHFTFQDIKKVNSELVALYKELKKEAKGKKDNRQYSVRLSAI